MLCVDFSQVAISSYMALAYQSYDKTVDIDYVRHVTLDGIRFINSKFKQDYGDPILAIDHRGGSWRRDVFPYYKASRKEAKKKSDINWKELLLFINTIKEEIKEVFPYKVIEVEKAEADDIIGVLTRYHVKNNIPVMIISGDKDFIQLQIGSNLVSQWDKRTGTYVGADNPSRYLFEHVLRGDQGDGIPNVLSSADSFVTRTRQKPLSSKKIEELWEDPTPLKTNPRFKENIKIIDLRYTPKEIEEEILNQFHNYEIKDRNRMQEYFIQKRLRQLYEHMKEF